MSKHTPTPWVVSGEITNTTSNIDIDSGDKTIARIAAYEFYNCSIEETNANAQRIVACVNACEGMKNPVEHIEQLRGLYEDLHAVQDASRKTNERNVMLERQRDQLQAERDELLEVLKDLMDHTTMEFAEYNGFGPQRNKVSQVYDRIKWGVPNTGGGAS